MAQELENEQDASLLESRHKSLDRKGRVVEVICCQTFQVSLGKLRGITNKTSLRSPRPIAAMSKSRNSGLAKAAGSGSLGSQRLPWYACISDSDSPWEGVGQWDSGVEGGLKGEKDPGERTHLI